MFSDSARLSRRDALRTAGLAAAGLITAPSLSFAADDTTPSLAIAPEPLFELSPWLYMQFMEPLGTTDGSVAASWNHLQNKWRPDLVAATRELAPPMLRWGGLFSAYYHWHEAVGPRASRKPVQNLAWGGTESNQVGTAEFLDFCHQVQAEPLMCVNFESEGDPHWATNEIGEHRAGDPAEAAAWVDYCNNPHNAERISHGFSDPFPIRYWQLGNETSYSPNRFKKDAAIRKTIEFSQAMRKVDPDLKFIGWGDSGWAPDMIERAGEHINFLAFHHLFDPGKPLDDDDYRKDPAATWAMLMATVKSQEKKIVEVRSQVERYKFPLALTESHFVMHGRNRCDLNSNWATGVAYARFLNLYQRHGDLLKIANLGDFCGTRWQTNVIMLPTPGGKSYLMPLGKVTALYRKHTGQNFVRVKNNNAPDLDITASRTGNKFFLHVVNTSRTRDQKCGLSIEGFAVQSAKVYEMTGDLAREIMAADDDPMTLSEKEITPNEPHVFPAASVTVVEMSGQRV